MSDHTISPAPQVKVELVTVLTKRERRLAWLHDSAREADRIARERNSQTRINREKYGNTTAKSR